MLAIEMLPAGNGDALVVEYGPKRKTIRILIDAGPLHAWDQVRARLLAMPDKPYEVFVITHVDEDHIGGAVRLLGDPDLRHRVTDVWFNGYGHCKRGGNVLGPVDGERLTRAIYEGEFRWNEPFRRRLSSTIGGPVVIPAQGDLPTIPLDGGALVHLLSPTGPRLKRMANVWCKAVENAGLVPGHGTDRPARPAGPHHRSVAPLDPTITRAQLDALADDSPVDSSPANGSSIAFLLEHEGQRLLLSADAHPGVLVQALRRFGNARGESRVRVDLCKLPHHGSGANATTALIESIDTSRYLISTDGATFGHPDDRAIARVIRSSARPPSIYCNYASDRTTSWTSPARSLDATVILPKTGHYGIRVSAG